MREEVKKKIIKIPGIVFVGAGIISAPFSKLLSSIIFTVWLIKQFLNKEQWAKSFVKAFLKTVIIAVIAERLFTSWFGVWWWEYSRGGVKFTLSQFTSDEERKYYIEINYPVGSYVNKALYDLETSGASCA